jgi:putative Mg2+ transporter-C (MgtC) family protein
MNGGPYEFLQLPELANVVRITIRLVTAAVLGGLIGVEREWVGKAAGLRTHMLVSLGAATSAVAPGMLSAGSTMKRATRPRGTGVPNGFRAPKDI